MKDLKLSIEISRELASSVLGLNVVYTESCEHRDGIIGIWTDINTKPIEEISIYEFAFKCKKWILNKEYHINTSEDSINNYIYLYKMIKNDLGYEIDKSNGVQFDSKGYIYNLFEACEWILKSLNKKI